MDNEDQIRELEEWQKKLKERFREHVRVIKVYVKMIKAVKIELKRLKG
jgi:hypothetical protein